MTAIAPTLELPRRRSARAHLAPLATLAARRFQLVARTPRELLVPLLTPIMFALVIAPALMQALHTGASYESFVAIGTVGLLIPLNTMFAGLGVIVDRESGAQRELLAAPVPRALLVLGNLSVALAVTAVQVVALIVFALARGIHFNASAIGVVHGIWKLSNPTAMAGLSLAVVGVFAVALTAVSVRAFTRAALRCRRRGHRSKPARLGESCESATNMRTRGDSQEIHSLP